MVNLLDFCEIVELRRIPKLCWTNVCVSVLLFFFSWTLEKFEISLFSLSLNDFFKNVALISLYGVEIMYFDVFKI